ncbi:setd3, partial [Symbiodinium microadriaticum]
MDMCGFNTVSQQIRAVVDRQATRSQDSCAPSELEAMDKGSLTYRTLQQIHDVLRAKANQYATDVSQDRNILHSLDANLTDLLSAGAEVSVHTPAGAILREVNAVRYRYFMKLHLRGLCRLYGVDCFDDDSTGGEDGGDASVSCASASNVTVAKTVQVTEEDDVEELDSGEKINMFDEWSRNDRTDDGVLQRRLSQFNKWFNSLVRPPAVNHLKADLIPGFRVGTTATKDLNKEELYLAVPNEAIIDSHKADRDGRFGKLLFDLERRFRRRDDFHELLLYLVYQCFVVGSESKYWPYLRLLPSPTELDRPLMWSKEQVEARLGPSFIKESIFRYKDNVAATYRGVSGVDVISPYLRPEYFTEEVYTWATSILDSRSIWWSGVRHLVPMLDFVNCLETVNGADVIRVHSTKFDRVPNAGEEVFSGDPRHALTYAAWPFKSGEQVVENYGQPSHTYFMHHGFFVESSVYDCVHFVLSISLEEKADIDWMSAQNIVQKINLRRRKEDGDKVPTMAFCLEEKMKWADIPSHVWLYLTLK